MKQKLLWAGLAAASLAAVAALFLVPDVFGGLEQKATLDRAAALQKAQDKALSLNLGPSEAHTALVFSNDDAAQAFVELKGGGLAVLNREIHAGTYTPSRWTVRRFQEGQIFEASFFFSPGGAFLGWNEKHAETEDLPSLSADAAFQEAVDRARVTGVVDLSGWKAVESSSVTQASGRVDWTLVWEKPESPFGDGKLRWTAGVAGDQVVRLEPSLKVPETFVRWYDTERSVNGTISTLSMVSMGLLFLVCAGAALRLGRTKEVAWKRSWIAGAVLGLGATAGSINSLSQLWMNYDTALPAVVFWVTQAVTLGLVLVISTLLFGLTLAGADALYRRAFPGALSLGTHDPLSKMAPSAVGGRVAGAFLAVPLWLLAVTLFYAFTKSAWGWWTPASGLADPNTVGQFIPWLTPVGNALQAGVWEEFFFRAVPLALAAWAGKKWGKPGIWMAGALVLQAVVFAAGHASYPGLPGWSRLVELLLPALAFGLIVLRWGLVPAVLIHFGYDLVLMSQPIFTTGAASLVPDRIALVLVALALPTLALWNRFGRRLPGAEKPETVSLSAKAMGAAPAEKVLGPVPKSVPALVSPSRPLGWPWIAAMATAGAAVLVLTWQPPLATLTVDRQTAQTVALQALADQGFVPNTDWHPDVTALGDAGNDDRFVRSVAGEAGVRAAREGRFIDPPRWVFQWSDYHSDVQKRERWQVSVASDDRALRVRRFLPEDLPGARLTKDDATAVAIAALPNRLGLEASAVVLKSAVETSLPGRSDWAFDFDVPRSTTEQWSARAHVQLSGNQVTDAYRSVFVPENWSRDWTQESSVTGLVNLALGGILAGLIGWGLVRGFRAWSRKEFHGPVFWTVAGTLTVLFTLVMVNTWDSQAQAFVLSQPFEAQALPLILLVPLVFAILGLAWGLLAGSMVPAGTPWRPLAAQRYIPGLALGLALSGSIGLITFFFPLGASFVANVSQGAGTWSWASSALGGLGLPFTLIPALFVWNRARDQENRGRTWLAWVLVFLAGVGYHFGLTLDTWQNALARSGLAALVIVGAWWLSRRDSATLVTAVGTMVILGFLPELAEPSYPGSWVAVLVGIPFTALTVFVLAGWQWDGAAIAGEGQPDDVSMEAGSSIRNSAP